MPPRTGSKRFPRGCSPFFTPLAGDVLRFNDGQIRVVIDSRGGWVTYYREVNGEAREQESVVHSEFLG